MSHCTSSLIVSCHYAVAALASLRRFAGLGTIALGQTPRIISLEDERNPGTVHENPQKDDANSFVRAASALRILDSYSENSVHVSDRIHVLIAQDSRRQLAVATLSLSYQDILNEPAAFKMASLHDIRNGRGSDAH